MSNQNNSNPPSNPLNNQGFTITGNTITGGGQWVTISIPYTNIAAPVPNVPEMCEEPPTKKKRDKDGETCKKCEEFYPYAEPNQDDGTLVCYSCRHGF